MIKLYHHSIGYLQYHCFSLWVLSICCNVWLSSSAQQLWWHINSRVMWMYLYSQVHQLMLKHWERKENYIFQGILQNISCCLYFANVPNSSDHILCGLPVCLFKECQLFCMKCSWKPGNSTCRQPCSWMLVMVDKHTILFYWWSWQI